MKEKIIDETTERIYFTQICNLIDELDLSPLAIALYFHYKRWSNSKRKPNHGIQFFKDKYKVGAASIHKAKEELVENGLMKFKKFDAKLQKGDEAFIVDIWNRNHKYFQSLKDEAMSDGEQVAEPMSNQTQGYAQPDIGLCPTGNALKEKKETKKEEDKSAQNADDHADSSQATAQSDTAKGHEAAADGERIQEVFKFWQTTLKKSAHSLTADRRRIIATRLKEFTPDELKQAIRGVTFDDWLMGRDPKSKRAYTDFETIFRNSSKVESLIEECAKREIINPPARAAEMNILAAEMDRVERESRAESRRLQAELIESQRNGTYIEPDFAAFRALLQQQQQQQQGEGKTQWTN